MVRRKTKPKKNNLPKTPQPKKSKVIKSLKKNTTISGKENQGEIQKSQIDHSKTKQSKRFSPPSKTPKCSKKNCKITAKHHHGLVI